MDDTGRLALAVAGLAILGLLGAATATQLLGPEAPVGDGPPDEPTFVSPVPGGSELWPYTSRSRAFADRTLPINVLALADETTVRDAFRRRAVANWSRRPHPQEPPNATDPIVGVVGEDLVWLPAHGARRFSFVRTPDGTGHWLAESYQLYDGAYLGTRDHLRAYTSPDDEWTAIQAHNEYWDWFRLRHTVTTTAETQAVVEAQFRDSGRADDVSRMVLGNAGGDADGVATVLRFGTLALLVAVGGRIRARRPSPSDARRALLFGAVVAIILGVRFGGVALEGQFRSVSPKVIAGGLYPVLAVGLPIATARIARGLSVGGAVSAAAAGLLVALLLEHALLELAGVPIELLLHRLGASVALGVVAAGGAATGPSGKRLLLLGGGGWTLSLTLPLVGLI